MPLYTTLDVVDDLALRQPPQETPRSMPVRTVQSTDRVAVQIDGPSVAGVAGVAEGPALHCRKHARHEFGCVACAAINGGAVQEVAPSGTKTLTDVAIDAYVKADRPSTCAVAPMGVGTAVETGLEIAPSPRPGPSTDDLPAAPTSVALWADPCPTFTYLAGAAGSGKTTATREWAERPGAGLVLCATTGIAAINLGGETINSILGFFNTESLQEAFVNGFLTARLGKLWRSGVKRLVVDEVSMLAGDQLTFLVKAIDEVNGKGYVLDSGEVDEDSGPVGMGLTLVGDFAQLPPVKATFAFESPEWSRFEGASTITLQEIRRQADPEFIQALRDARVGNGRRAFEYFATACGLQQETDDRFEGPTLLARNNAVDRYNWLRMSRLPGRDVAFTSSRWGKQRSEWGDPKKPAGEWGIPERLALKIGTLVMILSNERTIPLVKGERGALIYVNGDLGELVDAIDQTALVRLQRTGEVVRVVPVARQVKIPCDSARRTELRAAGEQDKIDGKYEIVGGITYMPLRLAYASTVHRSQGLSLDKVQINIRDGFWKTGGMLYVGLSRARTSRGLRIVGSPAAFVERCSTDPRVRGFL